MEQYSGLNELIDEYRTVLPAESRTAQAIDAHEPIERIALRAIEDGYTEFSQRVAQSMESSLRRAM